MIDKCPECDLRSGIYIDIFYDLNCDNCGWSSRDGEQ